MRIIPFYTQRPSLGRKMAPRGLKGYGHATSPLAANFNLRLQRLCSTLIRRYKVICMIFLINLAS